MLLDDEAVHRLREFIDGLNVQEAREAYGMLARKLDALARLNETVALEQYSIGERVAFHHDRQHIEGVIVRINLRSVSIVAADGRRWTVSPHYVAKVIHQSQPAVSTLHYSRTQTKNKGRKKHKKRR